MSNQKDSGRLQVKCENCGSNMLYGVSKKALWCKNCDTTKPVLDTTLNQKHPLGTTELNDDIKHDHTSILKCENCGVDILFSRYEVAKKCPYCLSSNVLSLQNVSGLKPDNVLRFEYDEEQARERFSTNIRKKFFAPRKFKKSLPNKVITSLYIPCFNFDSKTSTAYVGVLYKTTRDSKGNSRTVSFTVKGTINLTHENVLIESSRKLNQKILDGIQPYDLRSKVDFKQEYLLGFDVERYDTMFGTSVKNFQSTIREKIEKAIIRKHGANGKRSLKLDTKYLDVKYEYDILPVYLVQYTYKNKKYDTYMNGQSGKIGGKYPLSPLKIGLAISLGLTVLLCIIFALSSAYM